MCIPFSVDLFINLEHITMLILLYVLQPSQCLNCNEFWSAMIFNFALLQREYQTGLMLSWPMSLCGLLEQGRLQLLLRHRR